MSGESFLEKLLDGVTVEWNDLTPDDIRVLGYLVRHINDTYRFIANAD